MHGEFESFQQELLVAMTRDNLCPPHFISVKRNELMGTSACFSEETERIVRMTVDRKRNYRAAEPVSEPVSSILLLHTARDPNTLYSRASRYLL